jgi:hypothetical protein
MVHPTLLLFFPSARSLLEPLYPVWEKRLGSKALALEKAQPQAWREGLGRLLNQNRLLALRARGFPPDPAPTLVVLGSPLDEALEETLADLEAFFLGAGSQGLEARLHLVLLLRDPQEFQAAGRFPPNPAHPLPSRVWPLALWNRRGGRLAREEYLQVWVQHFVEALIHTRAPLQPTQGRDWMGLGVARIERAQPQAQDLVPGLWEAIQGAGEGHPGAFQLPPPPQTPKAQYPPKPERQDCFRYPEWRGSSWEQALAEQARKEEAALEEALLSLENPIRFASVSEALFKGPKALQAVLTGLRETQGELQKRLQEALAEMDEALGFRGQRARYRRLKARQERGRPVDEEEFDRLEALFQELDGALGEGRLEVLLERDGEARALREELERLKAELEEGQKEWDRQEAAASSQSQPRGFRWFFPRRPTTPETPSARKQLCDAAWSILGEAHERYVAYAARLEKYRRIYREVGYLNALLPALAEEERQLQETLERIQSFSPRAPSRTHNPLVVRLPGPRPPRFAYHQEAARLLQEGILEHLWYGDDLEALEEELLEGAERLLAHTPPPEPLNPPPETWALLVEAATPQVPVRTWPEHRAYAYVLGSAQGRRWGEAYAEEPGREGEVVLFRLLYPLAPADLWREGAGAFSEEGELSLQEAPAQAGQPRDSLRPNPLLDELQGLLG